MIQRILSLPDVHTPFHINLQPILNYAANLNPHIIQYLGDTTAAESCNHWKLSRGIKPAVETVEEDYEILRTEVLDKFKKACPKAKVVYHIGNHEEWFYIEMAKDWKAKHKYGVEDNIDLDYYNIIELVNRNGLWRSGHLYFTHGLYTNKHHACKTTESFRKCIRYGHTHDIQEYTIVSPIDEHDKIVGQSIGCLCTMNPDYMKDRPNAWVNAFNVAFVDSSDGRFNDYTIVLTDGKFTSPDGRTYK